MDCEGFREHVLDVLYEEADPEAVRLVSVHAGSCPECREELRGLREVRGRLHAWAVPPMRRAAVRRVGPPRYFWALTAAASLLVAAGGALSGVSATYSRGPVAVRLGRSERPTTVATMPTAPARIQVARLAPATEPAVPAVCPAPLDREAILRDMAEMIRQSEGRQSLALRAGMTRVEERAAIQRRYDLARISAGLSYLDGRAGQQMVRTTELMGQVLQASHRREP
jgi:hypothetical protein